MGFQGNPDLNRFRGDLNLIQRSNGRWAIVAANSEVTISGMSRPAGETAMRPEQVSEFSQLQKADINNLMWCDWDQILRFGHLPEVQQYLIAPMIKRGARLV